MASWYLVPSLVALRTEANSKFPNRDRSSDGSIGDTAHSARKSDHNPDYKGAVHAYDLDEDLDGDRADGGAELWFLAEHLRLSKDPRIKYVIYEDLMFSSYVSQGIPAWTWRDYGGSNKHRKHLHISVLSTWVGENDGRPWFPPVKKPNPTPTIPSETVQEDDDMYLIRDPADGSIWLVGSNGPTHISSMETVKAFQAKGVKYIDTATARDVKEILKEADVMTRFEWVLVDLVNHLKK